VFSTAEESGIKTVSISMEAAVKALGFDKEKIADAGRNIPGMNEDKAISRLARLAALESLKDALFA
jgi:Holliday junction resolvasome RuvABC DNA-binding subunit